MSQRKIIYQNSVIVGSEQWFWSENYNALYKRDLKTEVLERVSPYEKYTNAAYTKLVFYNNKLIALPYAADKIMIYDISEDEFRYIVLDEYNIGYENYEKFYGLIVKERWLFMIGCKTAHVLKFDMETESIIEMVDLYASLPEKTGGIGYFREGIIIEDRIVLPSLYDNIIFILNTFDFRYSMIEINKKGTGFSTICKIKNQIWLFPFDEGEIIQWDESSQEITKYNIDEIIDLRKNSRNFLSAWEVGNVLWIIPRLGNKVLSFNLVTREFSNQNAINTYFKSINLETFGVAAEKIGKKILFLTERVDELILFDVEQDSIAFIDNQMPDKDYLEYLDFEEDKIFIFERDIRLTSYLDYVCGL